MGGAQQRADEYVAGLSNRAAEWQAAFKVNGRWRPALPHSSHRPQFPRAKHCVAVQQPNPLAPLCYPFGRTGSCSFSAACPGLPRLTAPASGPPHNYPPTHHHHHHHHDRDHHPIPSHPYSPRHSGFAGACLLEYLWGGEAPLAHLGLIQPGTSLVEAPWWVPPASLLAACFRPLLCCNDHAPVPSLSLPPRVMGCGSWHSVAWQRPRWRPQPCRAAAGCSTMRGRCEGPACSSFPARALLKSASLARQLLKSAGMARHQRKSAFLPPVSPPAGGPSWL